MNECYRYILTGEDKKSLSIAKNSLSNYGNSFIGYLNDTRNLLVHLRKCLPELIVIDINKNFFELKEMFTIIDDEMLSIVILIIDLNNKSAIEFVSESKSFFYVLKPITEDLFINVFYLAKMANNRSLKYEKKIKKINETLENRKSIEMAKWIIVKNKGLSESEAHEMIRKRSRESRINMGDVARAIILGKI